MYRLCLLVLLGVWHASAQLTTPAPGSAIDCNVVGIQNCGKCNLPGMTCAFCADNFVLAADYKSCIACDPNCIDCVLDSTGKIGMCQMCAPGYEVKSDGTCGQCGSFCATCTFTDAAETQTDCLACFPTSVTVLYPYLLGSYSKQCQDCTQVTSGCSSCTEAADKSLSCTGCQPRFLAVSNAGVKTCTPCPSHCLSCTMAKTATFPTTCATCETNYVANSATSPTYACLYCDPNKCSKCSNIPAASSPAVAQCQTCQKGYYLDASTKLCQACPAGCATCTSSTACQSCISSGFFFDATANQCKACSYGCNTCTFSTNGEACTACMAGFGLQSSGSVSCQECPEFCKTCSDPATCVECISADYVPVIDVDGTFCMLCPDNCFTCADGNNYEAVCQQCISGYQAGTDIYGNSFCFQCPNRCSVCDVDPNSFQVTCTTCDPDPNGQAYYPNSAGLCVSCGTGCNDCTGGTCGDCRDGYYYDSTAHTCTKCGPSNCQACATAATTCDSCFAGFYLDTNACKACDKDCICTGSTATCTDCLITTLTEAPFNFYDSTGKTCTYCDPICTGCGAGTKCTGCPEGYVLDSTAGTCLKCDVNCDTTQTTSCTVVSSKASCVLCNDGYYPNAGICTRCTAGCKTCTATQCSACLSTHTGDSASAPVKCYPNPTGCASGTLDGTTVLCSTCSSGYGLNLKTNLCDPCPAHCETCHQDTTTDLQLCDSCFTRYAQNDLDCSECPLGCTSCKNVNGEMFCTQCSPQGYYLDSKAGVCNACLQCSSCTANGCNAGTCDDGYGLASDQTCTDCATLTTVSGCSNCTDADSTGMAMCLDCDNGQVLDGWGANCVDAASLNDCLMPEYRPYECTPGSCNSPFEWVTDGPGRGQCGLHCAVCGDLSRGLFLAECQNANNNYTQELVVGACWVARTVDSAGNVLYARGGFDKFNCTSDNQWEFVDPANSATTYKCCQSGDGCSDEIALDGVAGASAISFSLALLFASILAALRLF